MAMPPASLALLLCLCGAAASSAPGDACTAEAQRPAQRGALPKDSLLLQTAVVSARQTAGGGGDGEPCLCVLDVDRTLTGRQGLLGPTCPGNRVMGGVHDPAYGGGELTLSELGVAGLDSTFCSACYLGVVSTGHAGGDHSAERRVLVQGVLTTGPQRRLARMTHEAQEWCYSGHVTSPFVLGQPDRSKHHAVGGIVDWYKRHDIHIPPSRVHFFGDRADNVAAFSGSGYNAHEISCGSRDGEVGLCGAKVQEIVNEPGVKTCGGRSPSGPPPLDSAPGRHGGPNLQVCQGDCDEDSDCAGGLKCFQRGGTEPVPGCSGEGVADFDYCYDPRPTTATTTTTSTTTEPELDSSPGRHSSGAPLQMCQGDCDEDADCTGQLRCFQRRGLEPVPGCRGQGLHDFDYCYEPAASSNPVEVEPPEQIISPPSEELPLDSTPGQHGQGKPLQRCQGDCDQDGDCAGGLRCFHRDGNEPVPGCSGQGVWKFDYCYAPATGGSPNPVEAEPPAQITDPEPELDSSPGEHGQGKPLQRCQGDCDQDGDCAGELRCFHRSGNEPVPGCRGQGVWKFDYCYSPSVGGSPAERPPQPRPLDSTPGEHGHGKPHLRVCQGDCDSDQDCEGALRCYHRDGFGGVPGCTGRGTWNFDYCVHPSALR